MGRSAQSQAERLQPGLLPPGCPRRGLGRAGAAPCPLRSPAGTGTSGGSSGLGSRSALGFGPELPYFVLFRFGPLSSLSVWWEAGLPLGLLFFFCHHRLRHKAARAAEPGEEEGFVRYRRRRQLKAGQSPERRAALLLRVPGAEHNLFCGRGLNFFGLGGAHEERAIPREITPPSQGLSRQS